jgi:hypothetical protein
MWFGVIRVLCCICTGILNTVLTLELGHHVLKSYRNCRWLRRIRNDVRRSLGSHGISSLRNELSHNTILKRDEAHVQILPCSPISSH